MTVSVPQPLWSLRPGRSDDECGTGAGCAWRSNPPPHLHAAAAPRVLRRRPGARDARDAFGRVAAPSGAQSGGAGRGQRRRHAAPLPGRCPRHRDVAPVAGRVLGRNAVCLQGGRRTGGEHDEDEQDKEMTMVEQTTANFDPNSVRKVVDVGAPRDVAWQVFTEQMGSWWPLAMYKIGQANAIDAVMEPRVGGRWYERGEDGSTCDWGRVLAWEPHSRLVLSWDVTADWQYDPGLQTEIEVRFIAEGAARTRVEFEHRRLDRYGARRDEMRTIFDKTGDWGQLLAAFAQTAATSARQPK